MNVIISPYWYGVCDIYIAEGVLIWIRLYNECNNYQTVTPSTSRHDRRTPVTNDGDYCHGH